MKPVLSENLNKKQKQQLEIGRSYFKSVEEYIEIEMFDEKELIIKYGKPLEKLYFLVDGKAKVLMVHEDGKRTIVKFFKPLELIGELSLIDVDTVTKDVETISPCICLSIPMDIAKEVLLKNSEFLLMLSRSIGKILLERTWLQQKFQNYELKNRLAAHMLMTENRGYYRERHTETAEFLSVSYRHLLYTIKQFADEGVIVKEKVGYKLDMDKLEVLSKDILSYES